jgi:hypothetical protein
VWQPSEPGSRRHYAFGIITGVGGAALATFVDGLDGGHEGGIAWPAAVVIVCIGLAGPVRATVQRRRDQRNTPGR